MHDHVRDLLNANLLVILSARRQRSIATGRDGTAASAILLTEGEDLLRELRVVVVGVVICAAVGRISLGRALTLGHESRLDAV